MSRLRRRAGVLLGFGFRAAPTTMTLTLALALLNGLSAGFYPLGFRLFTDAFLDHSAGQMVVAVAVTAGLISINWTVSNLDANVDMSTFSGGLTSSRGHEGDSFGVRRIASLLTTGTADRRDSPVFGCALHSAAVRP